MADSIQNAANALEALAAAIKDGWTGDQTFNEAWGWNHPILDRFDTANMASGLSNKISDIPDEKIDEDLEQLLSEIPTRCTRFRDTTLPYLYNGNAASAFSVYEAFISNIEERLEPYVQVEFNWNSVEAKKLLPTPLLRRLRSVDNQLNELESRTGGLDDKIKVIEDAHASAEALPTDLATLKEARKQVDDNLKATSSAKVRAVDAAKDSESALGLIVEKHNDAEKIVSTIEDAYSAATTVGLGQSFAERAKRLAFSMWVWVSLLAVSLSAGAILSLKRLAELKNVLATSNPNMGLIWINIMLGIVSVAGPVWLAWVSTKQIGQRFRLSEDYAFKAAVAKAYEGYRREAARIDEKFAKELFGSALARLDEAPLRYVEHETYGSPWHEMTSVKAGHRPSILANAASRLRQPKGQPIKGDEQSAGETAGGGDVTK